MTAIAQIRNVRWTREKIIKRDMACTPYRARSLHLFVSVHPSISSISISQFNSTSET